jgi:hypothetical protein
LLARSGRRKEGNRRTAASVQDRSRSPGEKPAVRPSRHAVISPRKKQKRVARFACGLRAIFVMRVPRPARPLRRRCRAVRARPSSGCRAASDTGLRGLRSGSLRYGAVVCLAAFGLPAHSRSPGAGSQPLPLVRSRGVPSGSVARLVPSRRRSPLRKSARLLGSPRVRCRSGISVRVPRPCWVRRAASVLLLAGPPPAKRSGKIYL